MIPATKLHVLYVYMYNIILVYVLCTYMVCGSGLESIKEPLRLTHDYKIQEATIRYAKNDLYRTPMHYSLRL